MSLLPQIKFGVTIDNVAIKFADASFVVPFSYATLVFATLYDFAVFDVIPNGISMLGALIIITGALFLAFRERPL